MAVLGFRNYLPLTDYYTMICHAKLRHSWLILIENLLAEIHETALISPFMFSRVKLYQSCL
jgi:hypothetical protein